MFSGATVDWQEVILEEVCSKITVGHVSRMADQYLGEGVPFLRSQNIKPFRLDLSDVKFISASFHHKLRKSAIHPGDVVIVRTGYPGTAAVVPTELPVANCADLVIVRPGPALHPWFLAALLNSVYGKGFVSGVLVGAAQQHFNVGAARRLKFRLPPFDLQERIAAILSAYDDLIENNTRRIAILEEMARALYQEWFVHFRFPGHEHVPLAPSPLGPIPDGWQVECLQNLAASFQDGDWIETKDQGGDAYRLLQVSNIGLGEFVETGNWRFITQETFERLRCSEVGEGDLLISRMPKPIGRAWMVTRMPFCMVTAVDVAILKVDEGRADKHYLYCALNSPWNLDRVLQHSSGTTRARIARRNLASLPFLVPPLELQQRFAKLASAALGFSALLREKSTNLRATRDLLLPKLISGEINVSALSQERIAEAAD